MFEGSFLPACLPASLVAVLGLFVHPWLLVRECGDLFEGGDTDLANLHAQTWLSVILLN